MDELPSSTMFGALTFCELPHLSPGFAYYYHLHWIMASLTKSNLCWVTENSWQSNVSVLQVYGQGACKRFPHLRLDISSHAEEGSARVWVVLDDIQTSALGDFCLLQGGSIHLGITILLRTGMINSISTCSQVPLEENLDCCPSFYHRRSTCVFRNTVLEI